MDTAWPEVLTASKEDRRELVLHGGEICRRIEDRGLDPAIYSLVNLNFLEISNTLLSTLSEDLGNLSNIANLMLHNNLLSALPVSIGKLSKMKILDVSRNKLVNLPKSICDLTGLHTLNASNNRLTSLPDIGSLEGLHVLSVSSNEIKEISCEIFEDHHLNHLQEFRAHSNMLESLPSEMSSLSVLKVLDVSSNNLSSIPGELSQCSKLKEANFKGNQIKDRRLGKLIDQCPTKAVLDYLAGCLVKADGKGSKSKGKAKRQKKKSVSEDVDDLSVNIMKVLHFPNETGLVINSAAAVADVRPFIVCCIVRRLDLEKTSGTFKMFINLQTNLHDGICQKRQAATIATHDLDAIKPPLYYDAKLPEDIMMIPLSRQKAISARRLVDKLRHEAEEVRKEKRRSAVSGIHKYLDLLKGKQFYPVLSDSNGTVISFPPITNSHTSKISPTTTDMLIEVTSSKNMDICKKIMDDILKGMLEMGLGHQDDRSEETDASRPNDSLLLEQVKVIDDADGHLRVVYPSRVDLTDPSYRVVREQ